MSEQFYDLFLGDCLEKMSDMDDNSIDTVITDPPYGLSEEPDMSEVLGHWLAGDDYEHRGGGFMGKSWDSFVPGPSIWKEVYRVMKPGACLLAFGGTRTNDLLSIAIRLAGFRKFDEIDYYYGGLPPQIAWAYGQGFPKSHDISKAIDKAAGTEREVVGRSPYAARRPNPMNGTTYGYNEQGYDISANLDITAPATDAAALWDGWGTALKPAHEVILCFYKPREGTYAENALRWSVAGLWIDGGRVPLDGMENLGAIQDGNIYGSKGIYGRGKQKHTTSIYKQNGRWPANLVFSHTPECRLVGTKKVNGYQINRWDDGAKPFGGGAGHPYTTENRSDEDGKEIIEAWECAPNCPVRLLDEQSGESGKGKYTERTMPANRKGTYSDSGFDMCDGHVNAPNTYGDTGGASRFFYTAKSSPSERNAGCEDLYWRRDGKSFVQIDKEEWSSLSPKKRAEGNIHSTVKPIELMRYLARLTRTPTGGIVLDPFMGSGSIGIGCIHEDRSFIGIEIEEASFTIAEARIEKVWSDTEPVKK